MPMPMPMQMPLPTQGDSQYPPTNVFVLENVHDVDLTSTSLVMHFPICFLLFHEGGIYPPPLPPGHFPHPMPGHMGPGPFVHMGGHTATTVMAPPGSATTVTVLQGEMFQTSPVQTVCPHCQQAIVTRISHDVGLMNTLFCLFCFFVG